MEIKKQIYLLKAEVSYESDSEFCHLARCQIGKIVTKNMLSDMRLFFPIFLIH